MNEILWFVLVVVIAWCAGLSLAVMGLWARSRTRQLEDRLQRLQAEVQSLSARVQRDTEAPASPVPPVPGTDFPAPPIPTGAAAVTPDPEPEWTEVVPGAPVRAEAAEPIFHSYVPPPPPPPQSKQELEALIGGNWLLKIGILIVVLSAVYFLKYAFDNQWIGDWGRVGIGAAAGLSLLSAGVVFHRKNFPLYGQALMAGGLSILYLSIYAAFNFYALLPVTAAFAAMALVTASGSILADRHRSLTLAVMSLAGGLLTPVWLSTGRNNETALLGYLLILDLGVGVLALKRRWLLLNGISLAGTVLLFSLWAAKYYGPSAMWTTEVFLVLFALLFSYFSLSPRKWQEKGKSVFGEPMAALVVILFYGSSTAVLGPEASFYWGFMLLFNALMLRISLQYPGERIAPPLLALNAAGIWYWLSEQYDPSGHWLVFFCLSGVFLLFLTEQILRRMRSPVLADLRDVLACLGVGIGYFGASYYLLHLSCRPWMGAFAVLLAGIYLLAARLMFRADEKAHPAGQAFIGVAITLVTLAIPIQLDRNWITIGWGAEAAVLTWIGFSSGQARIRQGGLVILHLSLLRLIAIDIGTRAPHFVPVWNPRAFAFLAVIAAVYVMAWLYRRHAPPPQSGQPAVHSALILLASALSVILISLECWTYFQNIQDMIAIDRSTGRASSTESLTEIRRLDGLRQLALSILWSIYSIAALMAGIRMRFRPVRLFGIGLFFLTIFKIFTVDIWSMERLYRIISTLSVGMVLLGAAFLYQKFRKRIAENQ
jgi:uncharacterized membrane protein